MSSAPLNFGVLSLTLPKLGESAVSNADRIAVSVEAGTFVIADGASRSYLPGNWAARVADSSVMLGRLPSFDEVTLLAEQFLGDIPVGDDWMEEGLRARGSHTTVLVVRHVCTSGDGVTHDFYSESVGDCLLVSVGPDGWSRTWPATSQEQFVSMPGAICTVPPFVTADPAMTTVSVKDGGFLVLMTDALGRFFVRFKEEYGNSRDFIDAFPFLYSDAFESMGERSPREEGLVSFAEWADDARKSGRLEDDDLTMLIIQPIVTATP